MWGHVCRSETRKLNTCIYSLRNVPVGLFWIQLRIRKKKTSMVHTPFRWKSKRSTIHYTFILSTCAAMQLLSYFFVFFDFWSSTLMQLHVNILARGLLIDNLNLRLTIYHSCLWCRPTSIFRRSWLIRVIVNNCNGRDKIYEFRVELTGFC